MVVGLNQYFDVFGSGEALVRLCASPLGAVIREPLGQQSCASARGNVLPACFLLTRAWIESCIFVRVCW